MEIEARGMASGYSNGPHARCRHRVTFLTFTRDQELWGMALWVEKHHGDAGHEFIASKIDQLTQAGEEDGAKLWQDVAQRYERLGERTSHSS